MVTIQNAPYIGFLGNYTNHILYNETSTPLRPIFETEDQLYHIITGDDYFDQYEPK